MRQVSDILGKTDQRIEAVAKALKDAASPMTYSDIIAKAGCTYDLALYVLATLCFTGHVRRLTMPEGPGRPKVHFEWIDSPEQTRAPGARSSRAGRSRLAAAA